MKKLLISIVLFYAAAYGMENKNGMLSNTRALEKSGGTFITLKSNDDLEEILDKDFLPEAWYRQIIEQKLVQKYDKAGNPLITLDNIPSEVLPLVKNALYLMKFLLLVGSEHKGIQVAYRSFQALDLSIEKAAALLIVLDYLKVPKAFLAGLARIFVQLTEGKASDLSPFSDEVKKEINRYFYLFYNVEKKAQGDRHLHDLLEFDRLDKRMIYRSTSMLDDDELDLSKQSLASVCNISKLMNLGIIPTQLRRLDLSNNQLKKIPAGLVKYCPKLKDLDLGDNQLKELPENLLKHCPKLTRIRSKQRKLK